MKRRRTYGGYSHGIQEPAISTQAYSTGSEHTLAVVLGTIRAVHVNVPLRTESLLRSREIHWLSMFRRRMRRARLWTFIVRNARNIRYGIIHARAVALQEFYNTYAHLLPAVL